MATRTISTTVSFAGRFTLAGVDGEQPPGNYLVETDEETIDALSFAAYHRVATYFMLPAVGVSGAMKQMVPIQPADLAIALEADATRAGPRQPAGG